MASGIQTMTRALRLKEGNDGSGGYDGHRYGTSLFRHQFFKFGAFGVAKVDKNVFLQHCIQRHLGQHTALGLLNVGDELLLA